MTETLQQFKNSSKIEAAHCGNVQTKLLARKIVIKNMQKPTVQVGLYTEPKELPEVGMPIEGVLHYLPNDRVRNDLNHLRSKMSTVSSYGQTPNLPETRKKGFRSDAKLNPVHLKTCRVIKENFSLC